MQEILLTYFLIASVDVQTNKYRNVFSKIPFKDIWKVLRKIFGPQFYEFLGYLMNLAGGFLGSIFQFVLFVIIYFVPVFIAGSIADKFIKESARPMISAFSIQASQVFWLCLATLTTQDLGIVWLILSLTIGLIWLLTSPGISSVIFSTIFQSAAFTIYLSSIFSGDTEWNFLIVPILFTILTVILLFMGLQEVKNNRLAS